MNKKIIVIGLSLLFVALTGCTTQARLQDTGAQETNAIVQSTNDLARVEKIEVIDFHTTRRCVTCLGMEKNAQATLEKYFKNELERGKITFQSINMEESLLETAELVQKYQPIGSSLYINVIRNGESDFEQDMTAWKLARQDAKFEVYFKEKIENLLK